MSLWRTGAPLDIENRNWQLAIIGNWQSQIPRYSVSGSRNHRRSRVSSWSRLANAIQPRSPPCRRIAGGHRAGTVALGRGEELLESRRASPGKVFPATWQWLSQSLDLRRADLWDRSFIVVSSVFCCRPVLREPNRKRKKENLY